jgi:hypothetical protein
MLSVLNVASFTLALGAIGQILLLGMPPSCVLTLILFGLFLVPGLVIFAISFADRRALWPSKVPPVPDLGDGLVRHYDGAGGDASLPNSCRPE